MQFRLPQQLLARIGPDGNHAFSSVPPARFAPAQRMGHERIFKARAATADSRDENLKASIPAAVGESKEERKRERLSEPSRSILDAPTAAIQSTSFSSRGPGNGPNGWDFLDDSEIG